MLGNFKLTQMWQRCLRTQISLDLKLQKFFSIAGKFPVGDGNATTNVTTTYIIAR